ncbi:MAG: hypothetical protein J6B85_04340 [Lachnospiraceae bacterium]|nr:hypothetical protein [Lachnospiraceae bacterium]
MKEKLAKLIDVKSIVTIVLTVIFAILSCSGVISEMNFMDIFKLIIIFYFGTQVGKKETDGGGKGD